MLYIVYMCSYSALGTGEIHGLLCFSKDSNKGKASKLLDEGIVPISQNRLISQTNAS